MVPRPRFRGFYKPAGQPKIDWSNPLTAGLRGLWLPDGSGAPIDLVGITPPMLLNESVAPFFTAKDSQVGRGIKFNGTNQGVAVATCPASSQQKNLVIISGYTTTLTGDTFGQYLMHFANSSGATVKRWGVALEVTTGKPRIVYVNIAGTSQGLTASSAVAVNVPFIFAAVIDRSAGTSAIYFNGVKTTGTITAETGYSLQSTAMSANYSVSAFASGVHLSGSIYHAAYFNQIPSDAVIWNMLADPFAFCVWPEDEVLSEAVGISGAIVTGSMTSTDAADTMTGASGALTFIGSLTATGLADTMVATGSEVVTVTGAMTSTGSNDTMQSSGRFAGLTTTIITAASGRRHEQPMAKKRPHVEPQEEIDWHAIEEKRSADLKAMVEEMFIPKPVIVKTTEKPRKQESLAPHFASISEEEETHELEYLLLLAA